MIRVVPVGRHAVGAVSGQAARSSRRARGVERMATWSSGCPGTSTEAIRAAVRASTTVGRSMRPPQR
ncbi:hypothetical protein ADL28_07545 [Streptomyces violaceusniger]|uniref:Uncharacterized protein n=1 Tax=Streptomyces violaceusniger TaxID=68280 RepID=A0A0X3X807_STRVO|nr:hypothetical protein ADL28_07545 [Streptomyces violaceusniger]